MTRLILLLALMPAVAIAAPQAQMQMTSTVQVEKTVTVAGKPQTQLKAPDSVVPGDKLVLATAYRNATAKPVDGFVVTNPVPKGVEYAGGASAGAQLSVDGGRQWGSLGTLRVTQPDGTSRAAAGGDVTTVRWTIARVAPGAAGSVSYRGIVR